MKSLIATSDSIGITYNFIPIYDPNKVIKNEGEIFIPDYYICSTCRQRVEGGIVSLASHCCPTIEPERDNRIISFSDKGMQIKVKNSEFYNGIDPL